MAQSDAIKRFTDADKEPIKTLTPIEGYEKAPLVSLREAVSAIETPIHNIQAMVWTAERNSENPPDGLTMNESASIHLYTMQWPPGHDSFYKLLNAKLRSENRHGLNSWYLYLKLFFTALYKLQSLKTIIWRGIRGDVSHLYRKDYIWWGVSSCTETMEVMQKFVGRSGVRTIFMIECIHGKAITPHSFFKKENEIILMPGTYLRVLDKWSPADDLHMIRLLEEAPPFPLLASPITSSLRSSYAHTVPMQKLTISTPKQPTSPALSMKSYKSKTTPASVLSSPPPKYKNAKLEQKINDNKDGWELWLDRMDLTDEDMKIVADYVVRDNKKLIELYLNNNQIGDKGVQYLAQGLQNNNILKYLDLSENQIGDKGAQYLGDTLKNNTALTFLYLSNNKIGNEGAKYLRGALRKNTKLTYLDLDYNKIESQDVKYLDETLRKNTELTYLDLQSNQVKSKATQYVGGAVRKNAKLTYISLQNNHIGIENEYNPEESEQNNENVNLYL